jgi:hypothetical protein
LTINEPGPETIRAVRATAPLPLIVTLVVSLPSGSETAVLLTAVAVPSSIGAEAVSV